MFRDVDVYSLAPLGDKLYSGVLSQSEAFIIKIDQ